MLRNKVSRREDLRALSVLSVTVPGLRIPNVSSLKCNVRKRKQTATAFKATQLSNEKEQDL